MEISGSRVERLPGYTLIEDRKGVFFASTIEDCIKLCPDAGGIAILSNYMRSIEHIIDIRVKYPPGKYEKRKITPTLPVIKIPTSWIHGDIECYRNLGVFEYIYPDSLKLPEKPEIITVEFKSYYDAVRISEKTK